MEVQLLGNTLDPWLVESRGADPMMWRTDYGTCSLNTAVLEGSLPGRRVGNSSFAEKARATHHTCDFQPQGEPHYTEATTLPGIASYVSHIVLDRLSWLLDLRQ